MSYRGRQISRAGKELKKKTIPVVGAGKRPSYPQCVKGQRHVFGIGVTEPPQLNVAGLVSRRWWKGVQLGIYRSVCASLGTRKKGGRGGCFAPTGTSMGIVDFPSMVLDGLPSCGAKGMGGATNDGPACWAG